MNALDAGDETPLHYAADRGLSEERSAEVVELLLKAGADVNAVSGMDGRTALHVAAETAEPSAELMRLLLQAGANPEAMDQEGRTAQDIARMNVNRMAPAMLTRALATARRDTGRSR